MRGYAPHLYIQLICFCIYQWAICPRCQCIVGSLTSIFVPRATPPHFSSSPSPSGIEGIEGIVGNRRGMTVKPWGTQAVSPAANGAGDTLRLDAGLAALRRHVDAGGSDLADLERKVQLR